MPTEGPSSLPAHRHSIASKRQEGARATLCAALTRALFAVFREKPSALIRAVFAVFRAKPAALAALATALFAMSTASAQSALEQPRTLKRQADPLVLSGSQLAPLLGTPLRSIGCFRAQACALVSVPCQLDERTPEGELVLPLGPDANPDDSDGQLSAKDELVFMAHDTGARCTSPDWPARLRRGIELELVDPLDRSASWLYVGAFDGDAPRSTVDYVRYTPGAERVEGSSYVLGFSKQAPIVFDTLVLKREAGGSGQNPIDRMKIRLQAKVWGTISIDKTEDDYTSEMMGYIDGPVRVVRRTRNRQVLFWKIPSPSAIQDNYFYDSFFEFPIVVSLPFDLDTFLSEARLRISVDLKGQPGKRFYNDRNLTPVDLDGATGPEELRLDRRPYRYSVIYGNTPGDTAGWVNRLSLSTNTRIDPWLYYGDDAKLPDAPEGSPGQVGDVGYEVPKLQGLTKGTHFLTSVLYSFPRYAPGVERQYLAIKDAPLRVRMSRQVQ